MKDKNGPKRALVLMAYPVVELGGGGKPSVLAIADGENPRHMEQLAVAVGQMNLAAMAGKTAAMPTIMWIDAN